MTDNPEDIELKKVVKRDDGYYVVHCHGKDAGKAINTHPLTKEQAEAMHRAIQANAGKSGAFNTGVEVKSDSEGNLIVEGHFTTGDKDLVGDVMTTECLNDVVKQAVGKGVDIEHAQYLNNPGNEDREPFTVLKAERTLKPDGVKIEVLIRKSYDKFNEIKDKLIKGEIKAFSFAFTVTDAITKGGKRLLNKIDLKNITLTRNPINPAATITSILLKSLDDFETDTNQNSINLKMETDKIEETKPEQTPVEPEKKEITLEDLAKQVAEVVASVNAIRADVDALKKEDEGTEEPSEEMKSLKSGVESGKLEIKALTDKVTEYKAVADSVTALKTSIDGINKRLDEKTEYKAIMQSFKDFTESAKVTMTPKEEKPKDVSQIYFG